jgi:cation diffusion facilitator family transporter
MNVAAQIREKSRAALVSVAFNILSTIVKFLAAALTGSMGLLSEAIHSATDIFSSSVAFFSVRAAAAPPDEEHPFGHGKIESLAGFGEAVMLFGMVAFIVFESVRRLIEGASVERLDFGIAVMAASAVGAFAVARYVAAVGKRSHSLALLSNAQHLTVDWVTSVGVLMGLALTKLTGWASADPVVALVLAGWMSVGAWKLSRKAFHELIDVTLPHEDVHKIYGILDAEPEILGYHRLRTRRSGMMRLVDLHIVVPNEWSVIQAHELADRVEKEIESKLAPAQAVIHVDPYDAAKDRPSTSH